MFHPFQLFLCSFGIILITYVEFSVCQSNYRYEKCGESFQCGGLQNVGYPFWGRDRPEYCGYPGFELQCNHNVPHISIESMVYRVLKVDNANFTVAREDLFNSPCTTQFVNTTLDVNMLNYTQYTQNIAILYNCSYVTSMYVFLVLPNFNCDASGISVYTVDGSSPSNDMVTCNTSIIVPVSAEGTQLLSMTNGTHEDRLRSALTTGFGLQWFGNNSICSQCIESSGRCGYNSSSSSFVCFCNDGEYSLTCNKSYTYKTQGKGSRRYIIPTAIATGIFLAVGGIALLSFTSHNRMKKHIEAFIKKFATLFNKLHIRKDISGEAFIKQFGAVGPKRYSYSEIKKMTNSFVDKLGEGGYGSVYKGKLPDGRLIAVKVLSGKKGNGEDFINEVASISRTSHVNIVTLLGFCLHKDRRALIFQFMPNGSLDKFLHRNRTSDSDNSMDFKTLFEIAVGTARGLEYLHRGCNTRIVHFDIKPHNILLDEDFCPKISDFGLAKLSETKDSKFSRLSARGTIGYIAPEFIFRNFGGISPKSDVYSYGMMILEMVGVRTNPKSEVDRSSQLYFPNWIYEHLEHGQDLEIEVLQDEEEEQMSRKLILVGLWCVQTKPSDRPSMSKVVEMLEGSVESLQIPPKPLLHSPPRSPQESLVSPQQSITM